MSYDLPPGDKGFAIELGPVERTGAAGEIRSIHLRDPDAHLIDPHFVGKLNGIL
jgi:hypothetical protein